MKLSAPRQITFWIAVILAVLGFIGFIAPTIPVLGVLAFWLVLVGFVVLVVGNVVKGL